MQALSTASYAARHCAGLAIAVCAAMTIAAPAGGVPMFNFEERFGGDISYFPKYTDMIDRYSKDLVHIGMPCNEDQSGPCLMERWGEFITYARNGSVREQIDVVNSYFNDNPYIEDFRNWGVEDYWSTPLQFYAVSGDCEDYAIAKYYTLRSLGMPAEQMRIVILLDTNLGIYHAILAVIVGDATLILDNQLSQVANSTSIFHCQPIFAINELGWWRY